MSLQQEAEIKEKALQLKTDRKLRKVYPMVVFGDVASGEKEYYVAFLGEPTFPQFSKFMAASKKDEVSAMRTLAKDCFIDGDREPGGQRITVPLRADGTASEIITTRQSMMVNL